jgi:predicted YcjX-like family ATPase
MKRINRVKRKPMAGKAVPRFQFDSGMAMSLVLPLLFLGCSPEESHVSKSQAEIFHARIEQLQMQVVKLEADNRFLKSQVVIVPSVSIFVGAIVCTFAFCGGIAEGMKLKKKIVRHE